MNLKTTEIGSETASEGHANLVSTIRKHPCNPDPVPRTNNGVNYPAICLGTHRGNIEEIRVKLVIRNAFTQRSKTSPGRGNTCGSLLSSTETLPLGDERRTPTVTCNISGYGDKTVNILKKKEQIVRRKGDEITKVQARN